MSAIRADGRDVDVVVEPDMMGYIRNQNACGTAGKAAVDRFYRQRRRTRIWGFS